jgi:hypothetical protein
MDHEGVVRTLRLHLESIRYTIYISISFSKESDYVCVTSQAFPNIIIFTLNKNVSSTPYKIYNIISYILEVQTEYLISIQLGGQENKRAHDYCTRSNFIYRRCILKFLKSI